MRFGVEGFSGGVLDEFGGGIAAAMKVNLFSQPAEEGLVVTTFHPGGQGRNISVGGLPELGGGQVAQSVSGEVAKAAKGPVDVLEATAGIVGDF